MRTIRILTSLLALLAVATGGMDILLGTSGQANVGVSQSILSQLDPVLDSQIRFLGAVWFGLGLTQWICLRNLERFSPILEVTFGIIILGGVGRALAVGHVGVPPEGTGHVFVPVALVIELVLVPALWAAFRRVSVQRA